MKPSAQNDNVEVLRRVVAVVGCDGSGKSTLSSDVIKALREKIPTSSVYLGQSSGHIAKQVRTWPIIGRLVHRYLIRKAKGANDKKASAKDLPTTFGIFMLSLWRGYKFRRMLSRSENGTLIVTDRYPQAEVPGFYFDGIGLNRINQDSWLAKKFAAKEARLYRWMARHVPVLVIRLNVDVETAFARKPDHKYSSLVEKIEVTPTLTFNDAKILDLNASDPYEEVLGAALDAVHEAISDSPPSTIKAKDPVVAKAKTKQSA